MDAVEVREKLINDKEAFIKITTETKQGLLNSFPKDKPLSLYEKNKIDLFNTAVRQLYEHHNQNEIILPISGLKVGDSLAPHSEYCQCGRDLNDLLIQHEEKEESKPDTYIHPGDSLSPVVEYCECDKNSDKPNTYTHPGALIINSEFNPSSADLGPYSFHYRVDDENVNDYDEY